MVGEARVAYTIIQVEAESEKMPKMETQDTNRGGIEKQNKTKQNMFMRRERWNYRVEGGILF